MAAVPSTEVRDATCEQFPEVVALGYAVAALTSWSGGEILQETHITDYDSLSYR